MQLQEITQRVITRVENASNLPVLVNADPTLKVIASTKIGRGNAPAHLVSYNPAFGAADYAICYQCGFLLRAVTSSLETRFDLGGSWRGRRDVERLVTERLRESSIGGLNKDARIRLAEQMHDGLIRQLRSFPIGLRVDEWLMREYPGLEVEQRYGAERQLKDNLQTLSPEIKKMSPLKIYDANVVMNAAFATFWAQKWNDPKLVTPYAATGYSAAADGLLELLASIPDDPNRDRDLIDAWGQKLNLAGWYEFLAVK